MIDLYSEPEVVLKHLRGMIEELSETLGKGMIMNPIVSGDKSDVRYISGRIAGLRDVIHMIDEICKDEQGEERR